jgi:hypothetical protein
VAGSIHTLIIVKMFNITEHDDKNHPSNKIDTVPCDDDYCEEVSTEFHKFAESKGRWILDASSGIPKSQLIINKVQAYDSGSYTCKIKNIAGSASKTWNVNVKGKYNAAKYAMAAGEGVLQG